MVHKKMPPKDIFTHSAFSFFIVVMYLTLTPANAYEGFDLTYEEQINQDPVFGGWDAHIMYSMCMKNGKLDLEGSHCPANHVNVTADPDDDIQDRDERLRRVRRANLVYIIRVSKGLIHRLSFPPLQFMFLFTFYVWYFNSGILLLGVKHFDLRSHYIEFFKDPTRGIPGDVFKVRKFDCLTRVYELPDKDDPEYDTFTFDSSEFWTSEEEEGRPKMIIPVAKPKEPPIRLTSVQKAYLKSKLKYDEWGYPNEYTDKAKVDRRNRRNWKKYNAYIAGLDKRTLDRELARMPAWRIEAREAKERKEKKLQKTRRFQNKMDEVLIALPQSGNLEISPSMEERLLEMFEEHLDDL